MLLTFFIWYLYFLLVNDYQYSSIYTNIEKNSHNENVIVLSLCVY